MDCTPTSIRRAKAGQQGATLVEVLIGLVLGVMLSLAVVSFTVNSGRSLAGLFNYVDMQYSSRQALDLMSRDVRQARALQSFTTNRIALLDPRGNPVVYEYLPEQEILTRTADGHRKVLLSRCRNLQFAVYQQNPKPGSLERDPATKAGSGRVMNVSWNCYREIAGARLTTESVKSAKIVIRN